MLASLPLDNPSCFLLHPAGLRCLPCRGHRRACEEGFSYDPVSEQCAACGLDKALQAFAVPIVLLGMACGAAVLRALHRKRFDALVDAGAAPLKIVFVTFQIIASTSWSLDVAWPEPFATFVSLCGALQLDVSLECLTQEPRYPMRVLVVSLVPLVLLAGIWAIFLVRRALATVPGGSGGGGGGGVESMGDRIAALRIQHTTASILLL